MQPTITPRRTSSLGCLGMFSVFCLLIFSGLELGLLLHLNPDWFDRHAMWRGERFERELVLANDPDTRGRLAEQDRLNWSMPVPRPPRVKTVRRFDFARSQANYDAMRGGTLEAPEGTRIEMPPGSIGESCQVAITPLMELPDSMQVQFAGPVYELRVGHNEHYTFGQPLRVTMPYLPEQTDRTPRLAVYEGDGWRELPTRVDPQAHTVTAELPHASFLGVVWDVTKGVWQMTGGRVWDPIKGVWTSLSPGAQRFLGWPASIELVSRTVLSGTARGWGRSIAWVGCESIDTENFVIHYARSGDYACELNPEFDGTPDKPGMAPNYVTKIAQILEQARADLEAKGWPLPTRRAGFRYDVFLLKSDAYGESALNGPILLNCKMHTKAAADEVDPDRMLRHTVVHELIHVAQGEFYGIRKSIVEGTFVPKTPVLGALINSQTWWVEMSAAYSADWYWREHGNVTEIVLDKYARGQGKLLTVPMDIASDPDHYAYGTFLIWLDRNFNDRGHDVLWKMFQAGGMTSGEATLAGMDGITRASIGKSLGDLFLEFAEDYYVNDIWDGNLVRSSHRNVPANRPLGDHFGLRSQVGDAKEFINVSRAAGLNNGIPSFQTNDYGLATCDLLPHLTAFAAHLSIESLPKDRKAKLVVRVQNPASAAGATHVPGPKDIEFLFAQGPYDISARSLPAKGARPQWSRMTQGVDKSTVIDLWKTNVNLVVVIGVNKSLTGVAPGMLLDRWLLMPPQQIRFAREGTSATKQWKITWKHEDLHLHPPAFADYVVYRKRSDQPDSAYTEVVRVEDDFCVNTAPDDGSYIYTVATEDKVGNISEKGRPENNDPFEGIWEGELALVKGDIVDTFDKEFEKTAQKRDKEKQADFAKIQDAAERSRRAAEWEKDKKESRDLWVKIKNIMKTFEDFARIGMPMELEIKRSATNEREYEVRLKSFAFQPMKPREQEPLPLVRVGERTLAVKQEPAPGSQPLPPVLLTLVRMKPESSTNTIREDQYNIPPDPSGVFKGATLKWEFTRKDEPESK